MLEGITSVAGNIFALEEADQVDVDPRVDEVRRAKETLRVVFLYSLP